MGKHFWNKIIICGILFLLCSVNLYAKKSYANYFIQITDATIAVKENKQKEAKLIVDDIKTKFKAEVLDTKAYKDVLTALDMSEITEANLTNLSNAFLNLELEQNPVDKEALKKEFRLKMEPILNKLEKAIDEENITKIKAVNDEFNATWRRTETVIRDQNAGYYGKIETAISFLRGSIEKNEISFKEIKTNFLNLNQYFIAFFNNEEIQVATQTATLADGVVLLQEADTSFANNRIDEGSEKIKKFIEIWPTIESDVSTRNGALYTRIETDLPVIMVKGNEVASQEKLKTIINDLLEINPTKKYNFFDAMLILLREGIEALLITFALIASLKSAKVQKGTKMVKLGAVVGIVGSVLFALALHYIFPIVTSGYHRELVEGIAGIFAVIMMIFVGIWLHSKSSLTAWNNYIENQIKTVVTTGSLFSMFLLSFLAVFREGGETILFYVGILPLISWQDLVLGIGLAIVILCIIAALLMIASEKIKVHRLFFILTCAIYVLTFKMIGVSMHTLQFINVLPNHIISFPTVELLGIYPSLEIVVVQTLFTIFIIYNFWKQKK